MVTVAGHRFGVPMFQCRACGSQGTIRTLAKKYGEFSGDYAAITYLESIDDTTGWSGVRGASDYERALSVGEKIRRSVETEYRKVTEEELGVWKKEVPKYILKRGVTMEQVRRWELGYDKKEKRLIFPIRDFLGELIGVSGRDVTGFRMPKYKHYIGTRKETVLYGENKIDKQVKRAYLVEGFMDVLGLERLGVKNVLATMGTSISEDQVKKLQRWFTEVVFIPDGDRPGLQFVEDFAERLADSISRVGIVGVEKNKGWKKNLTRRGNWKDSDFEFQLIELIIGKDPGDYTGEEWSRVLGSLTWI